MVEYDMILPRKQKSLRNGGTCASSTAFSLCDAKMPIHVQNYQLGALHVLFVTGEL